MLLLGVIIEYAANSLDRPFSYAYNGNEKIKEGIRVVVPFNNRKVVGYVVSVSETNDTLEEIKENTGYNIKEIYSIIDKEPILNEELTQLASDISSYYFSPLISVYQTMLPPSLKPKLSSLNKPQIAYDIYVEVCSDDVNGLTPKQLELYLKIKEEGLVLKRDIKSALVPKLLEKQKIRQVKKEKMRLVLDEVEKIEKKNLTIEQEKAVEQIVTSEDLIYLLEGVTGSGKTEVYIESSKKIISSGKTVLMLVPEISLTVQMVRRFRECFSRVAILHGELTPGERYDEYRKISRGEVDLVIGARSAIFAPLKNIGLIIIDEEHSETYKQDNSPFYHALEVAKMRQKYNKNCKIVLGSATPSLETKVRALKGVYKQLYLTKRFNDSILPETKVIDMLDWRNLDNESSMFSLTLRHEINQCLNRKEQVLLLVNRRGFAPFISCRKCGKVLKCPTCGIPLSYHKKDNLLKCHHCGLVDHLPNSCSKCQSNMFIKTGFGTEKVEDEVKRLFPNARCLRLDSDVASIRSAVGKVISTFENEQADILIGTQMIAKGHDFKNVTLVGIVLADLGLNIPSYKSSERTFNLITQAIGRAGRHEKKGKAIIQTYMPKHYVIYDASIQDYNRFFNEEMAYRKESQNPPYNYLTMLTFASTNEKEVIDKSYYFKDLLVSKFASKKVEVIGPSEPFLTKINDKFRRKILLKYKKYQDVYPVLKEIKENVNKNSQIDVIINVDPMDDY